MEEDDYKELFISYGRSPDVNSFVQRLRSDLEQNGFTVWLDSKDIASGSDWHNAIGGGLYGCRAILPVITDKYISSTYCIKELYTADGDRKHIFPLMYEDVDFDKDETARGVKFTISSINWTMCRPEMDDYNASISRLLQDMRDQGLGKPDYRGPGKKIALGQSISSPAVQVGPQDPTEPILILPDVEMIGGITTGPEGLIIFSSGQQHNVTVMEGGDKIRSFGKMGILEEDEMVSPAGMAVNQEGELLVATQYHLKKFSMEGNFLCQVGSYKDPEGDATLMGPSGMTIGKDGRICVVETAKNRVKIFNSDLTFHSSFSKGDKRLGPGRLNNPMDIASNSKGELFVADLSNNAIQVFSPDGEFLFKFGKQGHGLGTMTSPMAVAVDTQDIVYVANGTGSISLYEVNGVDCEVKFIKAFGSYGADVGKFGVIKAMHVDKEGKLYVGEMSNKRIQVFQ